MKTTSNQIPSVRIIDIEVRLGEEVNLRAECNAPKAAPVTANSLAAAGNYE
jgi:hypothetical protein